MKHLKKGRKLNRERGQRVALLKGLAVNLTMYGKIKTTLPKAKELRPYVERLVTYAKKGTVSGLREVRKDLPKVATNKLYKEIAPRYTDRQGGYTRIVKMPVRKRDGAAMAFIEFVQ